MKAIFPTVLISLIVAGPALAEKPEWTGKGTAPTQEQKDAHKEAMTSKQKAGQGGANNKQHGEDTRVQAKSRAEELKREREQEREAKSDKDKARMEKKEKEMKQETEQERPGRAPRTNRPVRNRTSPRKAGGNSGSKVGIDYSLLAVYGICNSVTSVSRASAAIHMQGRAALCIRTRLDMKSPGVQGICSDTGRPSLIQICTW